MARLETVTLFLVRTPDGRECGCLYTNGSIEAARAFVDDAVADQYGDGLVMVDLGKLNFDAAKADVDSRRAEQPSCDVWWLETDARDACPPSDDFMTIQKLAAEAARKTYGDDVAISAVKLSDKSQVVTLTVAHDMGTGG